MKCGKIPAFYTNGNFMLNWRMRRTSLFAVLSSSSRYLVSILGGYIVEWKSMSNPNLWLDRLWLPIFLMRTSRNWCDFKLHKYSLTFHKVTPYMWTICRIKNHLCRLFLVANDIIIHNLPQVTEMSFCACIALYRWTTPRTVFTRPSGKTQSLGLFVLVLSINIC